MVGTDSGGTAVNSGRTSREQILAAVRGAIADASPPAVPRDYNRELGLDRAQLIELFAERVDDYRADVRVIDRSQLGRVIGVVLGDRGIRSVVVPDDLDPGWLTTVTCQVIRDSPSLTAEDLDRVQAVITGSAVGIALTGTIVLDAGRIQGRRAISLVPDTHISSPGLAPARVITAPGATVPRMVRERHVGPGVAAVSPPSTVRAKAR